MTEKNSGCWICKKLLSRMSCSGQGYEPYPVREFKCAEVDRDFTPSGEPCKHQELKQ